MRQEKGRGQVRQEASDDAWLRQRTPYIYIYNISLCFFHLRFELHPSTGRLMRRAGPYDNSSSLVEGRTYNYTIVVHSEFPGANISLA